MQLVKKPNMIDYVHMYKHTLHHIGVPFATTLQSLDFLTWHLKKLIVYIFMF